MSSLLFLGLLVAGLSVAFAQQILIGSEYKEAAPRTYKFLMIAAEFTPWEGDEFPQDRLCMTYDNLKLRMEGTEGGGAIGLKKAMSLISGGTVTLELTTAPEVYTMPFNYSHFVKNYNSNYKEELNWLTGHVEKKTDLRVAVFDAHGVILFPMVGRSAGITAVNKMWIYAAQTLFHELLHTFSIMHGKSDADGNAATTNDVRNYGDRSTLMGAGRDSSGLNAAQMMLMGWFPKDKITWLNVSHSGKSKRRYNLSSVDRKFLGPHSPLNSSDVPHAQALVLFDNPEKQYVISLRDADRTTGTWVDLSWAGVHVHFVKGLSYFVKRLEVGQTFRPSLDDPLDAQLDWSVTLISNTYNEVAEVEICPEKEGCHDAS